MLALDDELSFSTEDMKRYFDKRTLDRGNDYAKRGYVSNIEIDNQRPVPRISAHVLGTASAAYNVLIQFSAASKSYIFDSRCSCPIGNACKHAAAVLFTLQAQFPKYKTEPALPDENQLNSQNSDWLKEIIKATNRTATNKSEESIFYMLSNEEDGSDTCLKVETVIVKHLKKGGLGKLRPFYPSSPKQKERATEQDLELYAWLDGFCDSHYRYHGRPEFALKGHSAAKLLPELLKTNRCYWKTQNANPLQLGEKRPATILWKTFENGMQKPILDIQNDHVFIIPSIPLWYIDTKSHEAGPVNTSLPSEIATTLLQAPAIEPIYTKKLCSELSKTLSKNLSIPLPESFKEIKKISLTPTPCLRFTLAEIEEIYHGYLDPDDEEEFYPAAELDFQYENIRIPASETRNYVDHLKENQLIAIMRDLSAEHQYFKQLLEYDLSPVEGNAFYRRRNHPASLPSLFTVGEETPDTQMLTMHNALARDLQNAGWIIEYDDNYPYQPAIEIDEWYTKLDETSDYDWFGLELGVMVGGERINLLPHLIKAVRSATLLQKHHDGALYYDQNDYMLALPKGGMLRIPHKRLQKILQILTDVLSPKQLDDNHQLKITRQRAGLLAEIEKAFGKAQMRWFGGDKLRKLGRKLQKFTGIKNVNVPESFNATLRPYQQQGVNWLQFLCKYQLNGILADDMGLGKTVQALAHILIEKKRKRLKKPCLIVAPTSVIANWQLEAERFTPELDILLLHGSKRKMRFDAIKKSDVVLTTYPLLIHDKEVLLEHEYHLVILDEAQYIKNAQAKVTQIAQQLSTTHRLCLTGTPLENHLGELWSLFHFLMPGLLGSAKEFNSLYRTPIEKHADKDRQRHLAKVLKPFILRRGKQEVLAELPDKTEIIKKIEFDDKQRDLYESIRLSMHKKVRDIIDEKGIERSQIIILDALLKLRQVCCDPRLVKVDAAKDVKESAKFTSLMEMLIELISEGRRILLFSQFTSMLKLIEDELAKHNIQYVKITGKTKDRITPIKEFQSLKVPLFLISLKAGGTGLNLTAADTVIHYDPWWNPAVENQATDRAHRIGQKQAVFVYKLVAKDTVEEKIIDMQAKKQALITGLLSGDTQHKSALTAQDFEHLLT